MRQHPKGVSPHDTYDFCSSMLSTSDFSELTRVFDKCTRQAYVCKRLVRRLPLLNPELAATLTPEDLELTIQNEIDVMMRLRHLVAPVNTLYEVFHDDDYTWLILSYAIGQDLWTAIDEQNGLCLAVVQKVLHQLLSCVRLLARHGIVHRDLKPENLVLHRNQTITLIDWGVAYLHPTENAIPSNHRFVGEILGSLDYMAPEVESANFGLKAEVYSLGVLTYVCCFGELPEIEQETLVLPNPSALPSFLLDFLQKTICSEESRLTLDTAASHPFFHSFQPMQTIWQIQHHRQKRLELQAWQINRRQKTLPMADMSSPKKRRLNFWQWFRWN